MLDPDLLCVLGHEFTNEAWVPEFARDPEVFAASHERVGLAALGGGGDTVWIKVLLFAARNGDQSVFEKKRN